MLQYKPSFPSHNNPLIKQTFWFTKGKACCASKLQLGGATERQAPPRERIFRQIAFTTTLVVELRAAPVAALLVPLDAVTGAKTNPVWGSLILVKLLRVLLLHGQRLKASHGFLMLQCYTINDKREKEMQVLCKQEDKHTGYHTDLNLNRPCTLNEFLLTTNH